MARRVWIVNQLTPMARRDARAAGCPEICVGVPPIFADWGLTLPCAVQEPEPVGAPPRPTLEEVIERILALEG